MLPARLRLAAVDVVRVHADHELRDVVLKRKFKLLADTRLLGLRGLLGQCRECSTYSGRVVVVVLVVVVVSVEVDLVEVDSVAVVAVDVEAVVVPVDAERQ